MTDPFLGEIRLFGFDYAPPGWAFCNGQLLTISNNSTLFSVLKTTYGGDGRINFALPDLRGCVPMFWGQGPGLSPRTIGDRAGETGVALTVAEMPSHDHTFNVSTPLASERQPPGQAFAQGDGTSAFGTVESPTALYGFAIAVAGNGVAHNNVMPSLAVNFCIAVDGEFPRES